MRIFKILHYLQKENDEDVDFNIGISSLDISSAIVNDIKTEISTMNDKIILWTKVNLFYILTLTTY